ncbi:GtrA family protein [Aliarcobacter butzleri]|uniref:GtrA family protein n=1 Tax=Aliarcobacter butzleri TaxID=28197 RepID=UPI0012FA0E58
MIYRYLIVGIINTLISFVLIVVFYKWLNFSYNLAYLFGYLIAYLNSFVMNKVFTFKSKNYWKKEFIGFTLVFFISYIVSYLILYILVEILSLEKFLGIIFSMIIYTIVSYILNKKIFKIK